MGGYRVRILQIAQDDMKSIIAYIRMDSPDAAISMAERIRDAMGMLADHPFIGPIPHDKKIAEMGYRLLIAEPYLVFYVVSADNRTVEVHRVLHEKRNYPNVLTRSQP